MNKPIALILCGPPCIGKNTYIKNNKKYLHQFVPLSFDDYRYINGKYDFSNTSFSSVYESFKNDLNYYKELEIPIIINNVSVDNYSVLWFTSMLEDTFLPFWCKIVGHKKYIPDNDNPKEIACKRCHGWVS